MKPFRLSRRAMLRGTGVAMALPLLEAMLPPGRSVFAASTAAPPRFLAFYTSCGILDKHYAMPVGPITTLSPTLQDFAGLQSKIAQVRGVNSPPAGASAAHASGCQSWLRAGGGGTSVDQIAHKAHMAGPVEERTRFGSLSIGVNGGCVAQDLDGGPRALCAISWVDSNTIVTKDSNPQAFFDKLFSGFVPKENAEAAAARKAMDESVLSAVKDHANSLKTKMGAADKQVIDQYFTSIEALQDRINDIPVTGGTGGCTVPTIGPSPDAVTKPLIARALSDLTVLAFQCDMFRYGSYMVENGGDYTTYTHLGATVNHHELSHAGDSAILAKIDRWMFGEMAYLAHKMEAAKDITGASLLDSCTIMSGNEVSDGANHSHNNMPFLIAGGCNGHFKLGQTVQSGGNYGDVWVEVLKAVGYPSPTGKVGNSSGRTPTEILA